VEIIERLQELAIIPVVSITKLENALPLAESLLAGGLPCAEITFRTAAAAESISEVRVRFPEILLGAGTVLTVEQAETAIDAGAQYIVSPGTNPAVVEFCLSKNLTVFPGVCTPTEIEMALSHGVDVVKFFPAEPMGGINFLKAISAPYRRVRFIPTGGIDAENLATYLAFERVLACGGSWMVKPELINAGDFELIRNLVAKSVTLVKGIRENSNA
jgi:2-dehydro-3-deoxyphosphogluconate aldolase / (4S)-4-hydroxy-2-oxoglutarate aldolase